MSVGDCVCLCLCVYARACVCLCVCACVCVRPRERRRALPSLGTSHLTGGYSDKGGCGCWGGNSDKGVAVDVITAIPGRAVGVEYY